MRTEQCVHVEDGEQCSMPVFKRSYCLYHYDKFYMPTKTKDLTVMADLSSPPWGKIGRATKW